MVPSIHGSSTAPDIIAMQPNTLAPPPSASEVAAAVQVNLDEDAEMRRLANEHLRNLKQVPSICSLPTAAN